MTRAAARDEAAARASMRPAPPCAVADCGKQSFLPCHACGKPLCAAHGLTRLLVTHCAACAAGEPGTFRSHADQARDDAARPRSAPAPAATAARSVVVKRVARRSPTPGGAASPWGKVGTASELTKRLIMAGPSSNAEVHAGLVQQLGADRAGPLKNVAWYRNWLKRAGQNPPAGQP